MSTTRTTPSRSSGNARGRLAFLAVALTVGSMLAPIGDAVASEATDKLVQDASRKLREQDVAGALRLLEQAVDADATDATANILYQETARQILGLADLKARYQKLADENADDPLFLYFVTRLDEPETALATFSKLALKYRESPWPLIGRARALDQLDREAESIAALDAAVALDSGNPSIRAAQAFALERSGKYAEAADAWAQVVSTRPGDRTARIGQGEALRLAGQPDAAAGNGPLQ